MNQKDGGIENGSLAPPIAIILDTIQQLRAFDNQYGPNKHLFDPAQSVFVDDINNILSDFNVDSLIRFVNFTSDLRGRTQESEFDIVYNVFEQYAQDISESRIANDSIEQLFAYYNAYDVQTEKWSFAKSLAWSMIRSILLPAKYDRPDLAHELALYDLKAKNELNVVFNYYWQHVYYFTKEYAPAVWHFVLENPRLMRSLAMAVIIITTDGFGTALLPCMGGAAIAVSDAMVATVVVDALIEAQIC